MVGRPFTVDYTIDSEVKLLEMVTILKLEVSELQKKEEQSRKTIADLESERLRLLVSMTKFDLVGDKSFGEDLEPFGTIGDLEKSPELAVVPSFSHIIHGMESNDYSFARKKIDFTSSDVEGNSDDDKDPSYLPPAEEESLDQSECEVSPESDSDKIKLVREILNSVIFKVTKKAKKMVDFFAKLPPAQICHSVYVIKLLRKNLIWTDISNQLMIKKLPTNVLHATLLKVLLLKLA
jgi:hypothetical protein